MASVQCIWDQIGSSDVTINTDILPIIAEDASYKLWEILNHIKTFTQHSGGKVNTDIVNEVLKNCSTAPVVGAYTTNAGWQRFDCDGKFFCPTDRVLDLRQEYLKSTTAVQSGPITIEASWLANPHYHGELTKLWGSIILAIVLGDDAAFQYTIHTTLINPFIGVILPELVQKTIEFLVFSCTDDTLDRLLSFLKVLVQNHHSRDVSNNEEYFNLCNLFLCLLLGTIDMKAKLDFMKAERSKLKVQLEKKEREAKAASDALTQVIKRERANPECPKDLYGNFVVNPVALNIKTETPDAPDEEVHRDDQRFFDFGSETKYNRNMFNMGYQDDDIIFDINPNQNNNPELDSHQFDDPTKKMNKKSTRTSLDDIFSSFTTDICDDRFVDDICLIIGYLSGRLGYFEHEITYLLSKRLEMFFFEDRNSWTSHEFRWLRRIIQALTYLGETAFRELSLYFEQIPEDEFPEWIIPYLSFGAIYIRGHRDLYFYEYMQEICGDVLIPFLMKYGTYMKRMDSRWIAYRRKQQKNEWSIRRKNKLRFIERPANEIKQTIQMKDMFPNCGPPIKKVNKAYLFDVGEQIFTKPTVRLTADQQFIQSFDLCNKLNKTIIRRRMLRKLVHLHKCPNPKYFIDYRMYNI